MQGVWLQSLVGELRSHRPYGTAKGKKKIKFHERTDISRGILCIQSFLYSTIVPKIRFRDFCCHFSGAKELC